MSLRAWLRRRRLEREARRLVAALFAEPERLRGTSLLPHHTGRAVVVRHESDADRVVRVWFGIVRHPRPYAFSRQSHEVIEYYLYDVATGALERLEGHNWTRQRGEDAS
jgi:hypothetical protein